VPSLGAEFHIGIRVVWFVSTGRLGALPRPGSSRAQTKQPLKALTMQDSITESKTINYILFMIFC